MPLDTNSILSPTKEKKQHMLINLGVKHANKPSHKEALVGDGIQHRRIDVWMGWFSTGGKVTLTTYLTNLHLGVSYLTEQWETLQGFWVSLSNVNPRYNTTFPVLSPWVGSLNYYGLYGTTYYTKVEGGQSTVYTKTNKEDLITLPAPMWTCA